MHSPVPPACWLFAPRHSQLTAPATSCGSAYYLRHYAPQAQEVFIYRLHARHTFQRRAGRRIRPRLAGLMQGTAASGGDTCSCPHRVCDGRAAADVDANLPTAFKPQTSWCPISHPRILRSDFRVAAVAEHARHLTAVCALHPNTRCFSSRGCVQSRFSDTHLTMKKKWSGVVTERRGCQTLCTTIEKIRNYHKRQHQPSLFLYHLTCTIGWGGRRESDNQRTSSDVHTACRTYLRTPK